MEELAKTKGSVEMTRRLIIHGLWSMVPRIKRIGTGSGIQ